MKALGFSKKEILLENLQSGVNNGLELLSIPKTVSLLSKEQKNKVDEAMAKAIRRRVGHGKLNGVAAVDELKRLLEERKQLG